MRTRITTIHQRLILLAVAVALPLMGLIGYGVYRQFAADRDHVFQTLRLLQQVNLENARNFAESTQLRLERIAGHPEVRSMDSTAASSLLRDLVATSPALANARLLDRDGNLVAAAVEVSGETRAELRTNENYVAARKAGEFRLSPPFPGVSTNIWTCLASHPVLDPAGRRIGTVVVPLRLPALTELLNLPPDDGSGRVVGVIDERSGTVIMRRPEPERHIGLHAVQTARIVQILDAGGDRIESPGFDAVARTALVTRAPPLPWIIVTSIPTDQILRRARQNLLQALVACAIVFALGAYLVTRYSRLIETPIIALANAARDQGSGQVERLAPVTGPAEIAETARAFNEMVAARRQAEALLAESERRYRTVIDQTGQMIYDLDLVTNVPLWFGTEAVPKITGYSLAEFQSVDIARWGEMIHPDDRADAVALLDGSIATGAPYVAEYRFRHKDGSFRYIEDYGVCLPGADGKTRRLIGRMSDISARRLAELALRASEERLRTIFTAEPECVKVLDPEGNLVEMNPAGLAMIGADSLGTAQKQPLIEIVAPEHRASFSDLHRRVMEGGSGTLEFRIVSAHGIERWLDTHAVPLRDSEGKVTGLLGITRDITERRRAEEEREQIGRKLLETQKLESLGVLAGGIAHDFNNLLTGILGNAGLARLEAPRGWIGTENLAQIEKAALRAADLCKQMLAYSGKGRFVVQRLSLNELIEETTQLIHISISKKASVHLALEPSLPAINADATQLRHVVMNLVINASEALNDRTGQITIGTGHLDATPAYLATAQIQGDIAPGSYVFLEISDSGIGMDRETMARIFDPFFTTKFTGRGLGLPAVLGIVRGHKGAIKIYSEPGRGTTFRVLLPSVEGAPQPLNRAPAPAPAWRGEGHVLVVDDEESVRQVTRSVLEFSGFTVEEAADGAAGVAVFQRDPARFAAVLLDLTMPHMDGEEAFRQLRLLNPQVRVVLMSGFNRVEAINRFVGKGLAGFVQKPFAVEILIAELRRVLSKPVGDP